MSSPPLNKSCNRRGFSSGRFVHPRARVGPRPWSRTASSSASGASSWQPGHPVTARDSPRRMNLAVVPSATSSHRARTPGRPVGAKLGHATSRAQPHSAHFTACRATLFYAPISLDLTRSRQVAPPSRSKPALNSRSVSTDTGFPPLTPDFRVFSGKNDELPSREGAPGGLDRASGFPFPL